MPDRLLRTTSRLHPGWITGLAVLVVAFAITPHGGLAAQGAYTFTPIADSSRIGGLSAVTCVGLNDRGTVITKFVPAGSDFWQLWLGDGQSFAQLAPRVDGKCVSINDRDEVAYLLGNPATGLVSLFRNTGGTITALAHTGAPPFLDALETYLPSLSNSGSAVFQFRFIAGSNSGPGIYVGPGGPSVYDPAVDPALSAFSTASMNDSLTVAFRASRMVDGVSRVGIYRGSAVPLIEDGSVIPQGMVQISPFFVPVINNAGTVAFVATIGGLSGLYTTADGVTVNRVGTEPLERPIAINDSGTVAFRRNAPAGSGIYTGRPGSMDEKVIGLGEPLDGSTVVNAFIWEEAINGSGQVAFFAELADGRTGIYRAEPQTNHAPDAQEDAFATNEDTPYTGQLRATDPDGDPLSFSIAAIGSKGAAVVTDMTTGAFTYTPNPNAFGPDSFSFSVSDGSPQSDIATVTVTINPINDQPVALDSTFPGVEDTPLSATLQATDVDGDVLTYTIVSSGSKGTATLTNPNTGAFHYVPNANANGPDVITFAASDLTLTSNLGTFTIEIAAVNDAPAGQTGVVSTPEATPVSGMLQARDIDSGSVGFSVATRPIQGSVTITNPLTGAFTYTPNPGAIGYDAFTFEVSDGMTSSTATEMVFIVADSPRWPGQTARASAPRLVGQDGAATVTSMSADGRYAVFHSNSSRFVGNDTNSRNNVFVLDRRTDSIALVSVTAAGVAGNNDSFGASISADGRYAAFSSFASDLVASDSNSHADVFVRDLLTGTTTRESIATTGTEGDGRSEKPFLSAEGRFVAFQSTASTLVPGDTNGRDDVFIRDRQLGTTTRVSISSSGAQSDGSSLLQSWGGSALSADGRFIAFSSTAALVDDDTDGITDVFVYDRELRHVTRESVWSDGIQNNSSSGASISADGQFVAFTSFVSSGAASCNFGCTYVRNRVAGTTVLASEGADGLHGALGGSALGGYWSSLSADGRFLAFSASNPKVVEDTNFTPDVFVRDLVAATTVRVSVSGSGVEGNDASGMAMLSADGRFVGFTSLASTLATGDDNAVLDAFVVGGVRVSPLADSQPGGGGSGSVDVQFVYPGTAWSAVSNAPWITVTNQSSTSGSGTVGYSVSANAEGSARTGTLTVATQLVTIHQEDATATVAQDNAVGTNEDTPASGTLVATDTNGEPLAFSIVSNGALGTAIITNAATGAFTYTPNLNANGTDTFTFKVNDGTVDSNVATITVTIAPVNDAPMANGASIATNEDTSVSGTLTAFDVDGNALTFTLVAGGSKGRVTITNALTGAFSYTPNRNANGDDSFTFRVNDGVADSALTTVFVSIAPVNDAPVAYGHSAFVLEDTPTAIRLEGGDPENAPLRYTVTIQPAHGSLSGMAPNLSYAPQPNYNGPDSLRFSVSDGSATSPEAEIKLAVSPAFWEAAGPDGGMVISLAIDPGTPTTLYAGTTVGVFRSSDGGMTWAPRNVGLTGLTARALAFDSTAPTTMYAGTGRGVFRSTDSGASWAPRNSGFENRVVNALAIDPAVPTTLYAATSADGIFRSMDGGATWALSNTGLTTLFLQALAVDPVTPTTLYVGTSGSGVFRSTNGGATWVPRNTGLPNDVKALVIDPVKPATVYAVATFGNDTVFRSTDGGATWAPRNIGLANNVNALAVDPASPNTLYVGTNGGVFWTSDGGATWVPRNSGLTNVSVGALALNAAVPTTLYAGTSLEGVFRSVDAGATWAVSSAGLSSHNVGAIGIDPVTPTTLYAGTTFGAVFRSLDSSTTWTRRNTVWMPGVTVLAIDPATPSLYAGTFSGVFQSTDSGTAWVPRNAGLTNTLVNALAVDSVMPGTLYAGTSGGVFRSTDGGATWAPRNTGLTDPFVAAVAIDPATPTTLFVGTFGGVFRSDDSGATWAPRNVGLTNLLVWALAVDSSAPTTLYAGTSGGVFRSTDGGATWAPRNAGLPNTSVRRLALDPATPSRMYALTSSGVFRSTNRGETWRSLAAGLPSVVQALAIDPTRPGTVYAGTSGGVFVLREAPNDTPAVSIGALTVVEDVAGAGSLTGFDPDGEGITYAIVGNGTLGTAVITDAISGAFTYTPNPNDSGTDEFTFTASDGTSTSDTATVTVTITAVNDAPVASPGTLAVNEGVATDGTLNATDIDSTTLTFSIVTNPAKGTVVITNPATGAYSYTPNLSATGPDTFTFVVNDGALDSNVANVDIEITPAPLAVAVTSPNGGEKVFVNVPYNIRWSSTGATSVDVAFSRNGGIYTSIPGCTNLPGSATTCAWVPNGAATANALIRVTAHGAGASVVSDASDAPFTISTGTPSITVTAPNTAVIWGAGSNRQITWTHNLGANAFVRLELSRDGGASWETVSGSVKNTAATMGRYFWDVSGPPTTNALLRVSWVEGPTNDVSNAAFSIVTPTIIVTAPNTNVSWVIGSTHSVSWAHNLGTAESVRIEFSGDGGSAWTLVADNVKNSANTSGSFSWIVPGPVTSAARIRILWMRDTSVQDLGDVDFRIASRITVTAPNTAVAWGAGSTRTVTWNHNFGAAQLFDMTFSPDNGVTWTPLANAVPAATATTGTFTTPMPSTTTTQGRIRVSPSGASGDGDVSNVAFTLAAPVVTVTAPNSNVTWAIGSSHTVTWTHDLGQAESVNIEISRDGGATWAPIAMNTANSATSSGSFAWVVTGPATTSSRIRVTWVADGSVQDVSDVNFRIQ